MLSQPNATMNNNVIPAAPTENTANDGMGKGNLGAFGTRTCKPIKNPEHRDQQS